MSRTWRWRLKREREAWLRANDREYVPKAEWEDGPWQREADLYLFTAAGYKCHVRRHMLWGHLCGYVELPPGHPWKGKDWGDIDANVHGGLTWSRGYRKNGKRRWLIGFDCGHARDYQPGMRALLKKLGSDRDPRDTAKYGEWADVYREAEYVLAQTEYLAIQAHLVARGYPVNWGAEAEA